MLDSVSNAGLSQFHRARLAAGREEPARAKPTDEEKKAIAKAKGELTPSEQDAVRKLKARDAEVRAHEKAHLAAAGSLARSGPNYIYQIGPDGKSYAVGGDVKIDTSSGRTPEETRRKAQQIRSAALAVDEPSPQDLHVAAQAGALASDSHGTADRNAAEKGNNSSISSPRPDDGAINSSRRLAPVSAESNAHSNDDGSQGNSDHSRGESSHQHLGWLVARTYSRE